MPVERVGARKGLATARAHVGAGFGGVELIVTFAVVLPRECLVAARPFAGVWALRRVRAQMALEVETTRKRAATPWHGAAERRLVAPADSARRLRRGGGDLLLLDLQDWGQTGHAGSNVELATGDGGGTRRLCEGRCGGMHLKVVAQRGERVGIRGRGGGRGACGVRGGAAVRVRRRHAGKRGMRVRVAELVVVHAVVRVALLGMLRVGMRTLELLVRVLLLLLLLLLLMLLGVHLERSLVAVVGGVELVEGLVKDGLGGG